MSKALHRVSNVEISKTSGLPSSGIILVTLLGWDAVSGFGPGLLPQHDVTFTIATCGPGVGEGKQLAAQTTKHDGM